MDSMELLKTLEDSKELLGTPGYILVTTGVLWGLLGFPGESLGPLGTFVRLVGFLVDSCGHLGTLVDSWEFFGLLKTLLGTPWDSLGLLGTPWYSFGLLKIPCDSSRLLETLLTLWSYIIK